MAFELEVAEKRLYDWQYKTGGGFAASLYECMTKANRKNLERLACGFPNDVSVFTRFHHEPGYWEGVKERIKGGENGTPLRRVD